MHNESPRSLHLIHKKTVSKMALKTPLHFKWSSPLLTSPKRTAFGQTSYEEDPSEGGLPCPPGIRCNLPVSAHHGEHGALSYHPGKLQGRMGGGGKYPGVFQLLLSTSPHETFKMCRPLTKPELGAIDAPAEPLPDIG